MQVISNTEDILNGDRVYDPEVGHAFLNEKLNEVLPVLLDDEEVTAFLEAQNVNTATRKGYNDHGPKHIEIIFSRALQLYDLLKAGGCEFNGAIKQGLDEADEPVIIAPAAQLHDIGHIAHRDSHTYYLIPLASDVLDRSLLEFYDLADAARIKAEVSHAILCHHCEEDLFMLEAGVIRVADALDMEYGRSCILYEKGGHDINILSSRATKDAVLKPDGELAVPVEVKMLNAAGVYQADNLLKAKFGGSGLEDHVHVVAANTKSDDRLIERIELQPVLSNRA